MDLRGKKLLILGGAGPHIKVVESAKEMGIFTIVADFLPNSPAKMLADESLMYDIYDIEHLVEYGKRKHIDGVLGLALDPTQKPAQQIATILGLPVFGNDLQLLALTNKKAFKLLCKKNNVDTIPEYNIDDLDSVEYPCLVKPSENRGSRGINVCNDIQELNDAVRIAKSVSSDGKCIIEKYMSNNQDLTITYIVKNGEPILISLGDRYSGRKEDNLNRQLVCTIQPSRYTQLYLEKADTKIKNMIKSLGIKNGPVFFQGFVDRNNIRLYDPGIRFPGNEYERIFKVATGIDAVKSIISYCVGNEIIDYDGRLWNSYNLNGKLAIQYMVNFGPGKIKSFDGIDCLYSNPNIIDVQQRHFIGETIDDTGDIRHRAAEISVICERSIHKIKQEISFIQNTISATKENGESIIISPFDVSLIDKFYGDSYEH